MKVRSFFTSLPGFAITACYEGSLIVNEEFARDDKLLNFGCAFTDGHEFHVAVNFSTGKSLMKPYPPWICTPSFVACTAISLAKYFAMEDSSVNIFALIFKIAGAVCQQPRGLDVRRHIGKLPLDRLNSPIGLPNCFRSFAYFKLASSAPCAMPRASEAMLILPPSSTFNAWGNPVPSSPRRFPAGHAAIIKRKRGGITASHPELVFFFADDKSGGSIVNDKRRGALLPFRFICHCHHDSNISHRSVRDKIFASIENIMIAVARGSGQHAAGVTAGGRFR